MLSPTTKRYGAIVATIGLTLFCAATLSSTNNNMMNHSLRADTPTFAPTFAPMTASEDAAVAAAEHHGGPCGAVCTDASCDVCKSGCETHGGESAICTSCMASKPQCMACFTCIHSQAKVQAPLLTSQDDLSHVSTTRLTEMIQEDLQRRSHGISSADTQMFEATLQQKNGFANVQGGWTGWTGCTKQCGGGTRSHSCTNPAPV